MRYTRRVPSDVQAVVVSNARLSSDYNILALEAPELAGAQPGQFLMIKTHQGTDPLLRRPFSVFEILRSPSGEATGVSVLSKRVGPGTTALAALKPGERVLCLGPLGKPFSLVSPPAEAWMVAGGVGLAPFAILAEALEAAGTGATLFYGARSADELFCLDLFEKRGVRLVLATEDGSRGAKALISAPLEERLAEWSGAGRMPDIRLYACGPEPMLAAVARLGIRYGCPTEVSMERIMGCGLGGCYSCVVRVRDARGEGHFVRSCLEGPVLRGEDVCW
jgi:dihydroorotate dehydrogenase electron transfer subunit